ncbi:MAG: LptF/LptG family permease [Ignavibacteriae bacterium]|nr:LptF/LptG family permease [Ignavibacteriota bacterium]
MTLLDKYILKQITITLLFSLIALCIIFVIVNLLESLDEFLDQDATFFTIFKYYIYFLPEILKLLTPVAMLISTLFSIGRLSSNNEVIAMKSGGISLYRIMMPVAFFSVILSFAQLYFNGWVVPAANEKKIDIERKYLNKAAGGGQIFNLYFRDNPERNIVMQYYDADMKTGNKIAVEEYTSQSEPRLTKRIEADKIRWDSSKSVWKIINGIERNYSGGAVDTKRFDTINYSINLTHNQIIELKRSTDEMNYDELWNYITILKRGGKDVRKQVIEYYGNYAFPFANLIVILFGVPFASIRKKGGLAIQMGAAMVISFLYLVFTKVGQTIGYSSDINPVFAGWMANIIFFIFALVNLFRTRT